MDSVKIIAPAKLNLALAVTGVLDNGYHTVDMIMQAVSVFEKIEIRKSQHYSLCFSNSTVPTDSNNTATKAAHLFFEETGLLAGANIIIKKHIPMRAGMAGGSADAAGVLVGLNALYGAGLSVQQLCDIGVKIGADVPFAITGGTARTRGIGDEITQLPHLPECWFTVLMPYGRGNSTPEAYKLFDEHGSSVTADIDSAEKAIRNASLRQLLPNMQNMLEEANGAEITVRLREKLVSLGAVASMMTGSGAAVFGAFENGEAAQKAAAALKRDARIVFVCRPVKHGAIVIC